MSVKSKKSEKKESIREYLACMEQDAGEIKERLLSAPLDLTGEAEPKLFELIGDIQSKIAEAKKIWM